MKQIIIALLLVMLLASSVAAKDAPSMWVEQNEEGLALMVNTSEESYGVNAWVHYVSTCVNVTNVTMTGPYEPLEGYGWSQHLNCIVIALTEFDGVAIGEYQVAQIEMECVAGNCTSDIEITKAEPVGVVVHNGTFVCESEEEVNATTSISIGQCRGISSLPIVVENVTDLGACDITLSWNPLVVKVVDIVGRNMDSMLANAENVDEGWIRIGAIQTNTSGLSGEVVVARVFFEPAGNGETMLVLSNTMLVEESPECTDIMHTVSHGMYYSPKKGDVNDDGVVGFPDVVYISKHVLEFAGYEEIDAELADVSGDGAVTMADAMYLARHLLGAEGFEILAAV